MMIHIIQTIIFIELVFISYLDFKTNKISNYWSILNLALAMLGFIFVKELDFSWNHFLYPSMFLCAGLFLYALKIMGGGDVKLLFTMFLLIPLQSQEIYIQALIISTFLMALILFVTNCIKNYVSIIEFLRTRKFSELKHLFGKKFAYSPAILIAWILYLGKMYGIFSFKI